MKDSIRLMSIHREMLEHSAEILEIVEERYKQIITPNISEERKNKLKELYKHTQGLIRNLNEDLHILVRLITEEREIEQDE